MVLKHKDRELLRFSWNRYGDVCDLEIDHRHSQFLPIGIRDRLLDADQRQAEWTLDEWIRSRTAPLNRRNVRELLKGLGLSPRDAEYHRRLVELCRGLSLNDVHWIAADDSRETWSSVNLYRNVFSTAVATMAFSGAGLGVVRGASSSPEYTTNGTLAKCWRRIGDEVVLYKAGSGEGHVANNGRDAVGYEPYSEYLASQVAEAMGLRHVTYDLAQFKGRLCSTCPLFTDERYGYLPARMVMTREEAIHDSRFADMFFFDAVIFNTDRHLGNFGFLVDNDTNEIADLAPIFDNGFSLFSQAISAPGRKRDEFCDLRRFLARKSPALTERWLDIPGGVTDEMISRLEGVNAFSFSPHGTYNLPHERLDMTLYFVQKRIAEIKEFRAKADEKLRISAKRDRITETPDPPLDLDAKIIETLSSYPKATIEGLSKLLKTSVRTISRHMKALEGANRIRRIGSRKSGRWECVDAVTRVF